MEYIILTVLVKAFFLMGSIVAGIVWLNAGCPFYTITRR